MPQVLIRGLDDDTMARLKKRAAANNRSLQAELKTILETAVPPPKVPDMQREEMRLWAEQLRESLAEHQHDDSAEFIRSMREGVDYDRQSELDPKAFAALQERAKLNARSMKDEINAIIEETIRRERWRDPEERRAHAERARLMRAETVGKVETDSVELVRQFRENPRAT